METLDKAILRLEPTIDLLHDCLGFGRFAEVTLTSDGFFLGRARDDIGFNHFLGKPSAAALTRTRKIFQELSEIHQKELLRALRSRRIPPETIGISRKHPERRIEQ